MVRSKSIAQFYERVFKLDWSEGVAAGDVDAQLTVIDGADALL